MNIWINWYVKGVKSHVMVIWKNCPLNTPCALGWLFFINISFIFTYQKKKKYGKIKS